jgi:hypothetical protein
VGSKKSQKIKITICILLSPLKIVPHKFRKLFYSAKGFGKK